jgi:nucleoside-diphosphate-sugar epimerase
MNILVTGASGFVGRTLLPLLQSAGNRVRGAVRREHLFPGGVESCVVGDVGPATDWHEALTGMDAVVHLAARVHVMHDAESDPIAAFRAVNVAGTEHLARSAATAGVRRFIYLSSVKVNGEATTEQPFREMDAPAPEDAYGVSKWEAELALHRVALETGLEVAIIRPPLVYGPGVGANFLRLVRALDRGLPMPLGSLSNRRSLIYVGNLVDAIIACLENPAAAGKTYLVSDGEDLSTPELVRGIASALDRPARLIPVPPALLRLGGRLLGKGKEVDRLLGSLTVDSGAICSDLGWAPPFSLTQGLEATAGWYRQQQ